jgi:hypothetical protein
MTFRSRENDLPPHRRRAVWSETPTAAKKMATPGGSLLECSEDCSLQQEIYKLLKRYKFTQYETNRWASGATVVNGFSQKDRDDNFLFPSLVNSSFQANQSPRVDFEIMKSIYLYLRSRSALLLLPETPRPPLSFHLEIIYQHLKKSSKDHLRIPLRQQLELSLLW